MFGPIYDVVTACTRSSYTPWIRQKYPERVNIANNHVGYARQVNFVPVGCCPGYKPSCTYTETGGSIDDDDDDDDDL